MTAQVAVIMGSKSDWETMSHACAVLDELQIPYEKNVVSSPGLAEPPTCRGWWRPKLRCPSSACR